MIGSMLLGAGASIVGNAMANSANLTTNHKNRKLALYFFNKQMDETYQRTVKDMQKAGINPLLAISQGGNSASGSVPSSLAVSNPFSDVSDAISNGINAVNSAVNLKRVDNEAKLMDAQAQQIKQNIISSQADMTYKKQELDNKVKELQLRRDDLENRKLDSASEREKRSAEVKSLDDQIKTAQTQRALYSAQTERTLAGVAREKYGNYGGAAYNFMKDYQDVLEDYVPGSSANQGSYLRKRFREEIQREIKHWNNRKQNIQKLYHRVRDAAKVKPRDSRHMSRYYLHQSDFR